VRRLVSQGSTLTTVAKGAVTSHDQVRLENVTA